MIVFPFTTKSVRIPCNFWVINLNLTDKNNSIIFKPSIQVVDNSFQ